jgi:hypothetical protein
MDDNFWTIWVPLDWILPCTKYVVINPIFMGKENGFEAID